MNKSAFAISIMFIGFITLLLIFSMFGILYFYWGNTKAIQDSLSTTGSIFGAIATLGAAAIAAYLFNDWKEQHNKQVTNTLALQAYQEFSIFEKNTLELATYISDLEVLIHSYECELDYNALSRSGDLIYIQNIINKKSEMNIIFLSFLSKLRAYINIRDRYISFDERQSFYHSKFLSINKNELVSNSLI
ncbi:hypothetical protein, partial [Acinetobacter pittii]|uniref:hypothetical protein n=1 Tax=Acinetobacter pittii TaxID=48296 RepID=UPI000A4684A7